MDGKDVFNALNLQDHFILDGQVESVPAIELDAFVLDGQGALSLKRNALQVKLMTKAFFIGGL